MSAFKSLAAAVAVSAMLVNAQIPPNFTPSASQQLGVAYGPGSSNTRIVTPGLQIDQSTQTTLAPALGLDFEPAVPGPYILTMIDPDVPANRSQILHWFQPDLVLSPATAGAGTLFQYTLTNTTPAVSNFARPMPPTGSGFHRYIQYLWQQPADFVIPAAFSGFSSTNRSMFNIVAFAAAAGLGQPIAANYWLTANANDTAASASATASATVTAGSTGTASATLAVYTGAAGIVGVGSGAGLVVALAAGCAALL